MTPLIVAEAVWQYSHHVLHGLITHEGPVLTVANWSGTWPGLVGMLNLLEAARQAGGAPLAAFLEEAFTQTRQPDYWVDVFEVDGWSPPRGRLVGEDGSMTEVTDPLEAEPGLGLAPEAREADGRVTFEVLDPGFTRGLQLRPGRITRRAVLPGHVSPDEDWDGGDDTFHLSHVRVRGPAWSRLPVEVEFRFADGVVVRETWDGRAPYRDYRFLRAAPLSEARIDPFGKITLDPDPVNNARLREPDRRLVHDWALWAGALAQLLGEALASWL